MEKEKKIKLPEEFVKKMEKLLGSDAVAGFAARGGADTELVFSGTRVAKIIKAVVRGAEYRLDAAGIGKIQVTVDLVDRDGEISLDLVRELFGAGRLGKLEQQGCRVQDLALFLFGAGGNIHALGRDGRAVARHRAPEQIIAGHAVVVRRAHDKRETRLAKSVLVVAEKRLGNTEVSGGRSLTYFLFPSQQSECARKITGHIFFYPCGRRCLQTPAAYYTFILYPLYYRL